MTHVNFEWRNLTDEDRMIFHKRGGWSGFLFCALWDLDDATHLRMTANAARRVGATLAQIVAADIRNAARADIMLDFSAVY